MMPYSHSVGLIKKLEELSGLEWRLKRKGEINAAAEGNDYPWRKFFPGLFQLLVFFLRFNQNRNVRVGVFPLREEVLISLARFHRVALKHCCAGESDARERVIVRECSPAAVIENHLKLSRSFIAFLKVQIGLAAEILGH